MADLTSVSGLESDNNALNPSHCYISGSDIFLRPGPPIYQWKLLVFPHAPTIYISVKPYFHAARNTVDSTDISPPIK